MSIYSELEEVGEIHNDIKNMTDNILDSYKKNPKECERLLKELSEINKELEELDKEFSKYL
jgi:predicted  nucleic acid-binding Zn-ribbon protein